MATLFSDLLPIVRSRLIEPTANFWADDELTTMMTLGAKDLWRSIVDLKQEHFLTINNTDVFLPANATQLIGVPADVHKIYNLEPVNMQENGPNQGLVFLPRDYNSDQFAAARTRSPMDPISDCVYYAIHKSGAPVSAPAILTAPMVTSAVAVSFAYCPTLPALTINSYNPIPGESDNAVIAWAVAYARSKEREDRSPDPAWIQVYATEKQNLLNSLGLRQYQEPLYVNAIWQDYW